MAQSLKKCSVAPFPVPAKSLVACGFPALLPPAHFTTRVMGLIGSGRLRRTMGDKPPGTRGRAYGSHATIPCSTAAIQSFDGRDLPPNILPLSMLAHSFLQRGGAETSVNDRIASGPGGRYPCRLGSRSPSTAGQLPPRLRRDESSDRSTGRVESGAKESRPRSSGR